MWCVVVCDLENLKNQEAMIRVGSQRHNKNIKRQCLVDASCDLSYDIVHFDLLPSTWMHYALKKSW
jgi:hypothetical protein